MDAPARTSYSINLLGAFALSRADGTSVALKTRKAELLLAFLALPAGQPHPRDSLAALFWEDRGDEQARGSLRSALADLRSAIGDVLITNRDTVQVAPDALDCDVDRLARAASQNDPFETSLTGELLAGCQPPSSGFDEWMTFERSRCRSLAITALEAALSKEAAKGSIASALEYGRQLVALDPLRERSHRRLMQLFAATGERSHAIAQFQACSDVLRRELDVEPSPETVELMQSISGERSVRYPKEDTAVPPRFSLAVLPFTNLGGDPANKSFADGLTEDLITEFSRARDFAVIARQSAFQYVGRLESVALAASELRARYAVTGSLRVVDRYFRVNVQLIEVAQNRCIWAERYDRDADDFFRLEDDIVGGIAGQIDAVVRRDERDRLVHRQVPSLDAWELFHRGLWHVYRFQPDDIRLAEDLFQRAAKLAPSFALPRAGLAYAAFVKCMFFFASEPALTIREGLVHAVAAIELDNEDAFSRTIYGRLLIFAGEAAAAIHHLRLAIANNPSFAQAYFGLAQALAYAAQPSEALVQIEIALKLSPRDPLLSQFATLRSFCLFSLGRFRDAEEAAREAVQLSSREVISRIALAVALVELGQTQQAADALAGAIRVQPGLNAARFAGIIAQTPAEVRDRIWRNLGILGFTTD